VLYAHGFAINTGERGSQLRVGNVVIRQHLIDLGFAWAASSYRCNGYVPGQGLVDTMALTERFVTHNEGRQPRRTYLTGTSMGGHVTVLGMHEFPTAFAGGLAMCPAGPELFDFFAAVDVSRSGLRNCRACSSRSNLGIVLPLPSSKVKAWAAGASSVATANAAA
jgi:pimeloyl-ACP methyl ester carboxylesterase